MDLPLGEVAVGDPPAVAARFASKLAPPAAAADLVNPTPAPQQSSADGNAEEDGKRGRTEGRRLGELVGVSATAASVSEASAVTDLERKLRRAERFGVQVVLCEEEK